MSIAIISDIHGNLPALEAVLADIDANDVGEIWCLGDVVGYGAEPDGCTTLVAERCSVALVGNHDLAVLDEIEISSFSPAAAAAVRWTKENISTSSLDYLAGLEPQAHPDAAALYHASPRDPIWEYVLWPDQAAECLRVQSGDICFVGHSHVALFFASEAAALEVGVEPPEAAGSAAGLRLTRSMPAQPEARGAQAGAGTRLELSAGRWLINPGSVGQPRDGDPRAAWLEFDPDASGASFHRVAYEIDRAADAIAATELPAHLGKRLYVGQ